MSEIQQETIKALRENGYGYTAIAKVIGTTKGKVVAFCRKNNLTGQKAKSGILEQRLSFCMECGIPISQIEGRKEKKFCSSKCRNNWWNAHPEKVNKKAIYSFQCASCGKDFTAYGNAKRKYCSQQCYITFRYKGT